MKTLGEYPVGQMVIDTNRRAWKRVDEFVFELLGRELEDGIMEGSRYYYGQSFFDYGDRVLHVKDIPSKY